MSNVETMAIENSPTFTLTEIVERLRAGNYRGDSGSLADDPAFRLLVKRSENEIPEKAAIERQRKKYASAAEHLLRVIRECEYNLLDETLSKEEREQFLQSILHTALDPLEYLTVEDARRNGHDV